MGRTDGLRPRLQAFGARYPEQFWLLFWGALLSSAAGSLAWQSLTIYVRQQLAVPITRVAVMAQWPSGTAVLPWG